MWDLDVTEAWNRWGAGLSAGRSHETLKSFAGRVFRLVWRRSGVPLPTRLGGNAVRSAHV